MEDKIHLTTPNSCDPQEDNFIHNHIGRVNVGSHDSLATMLIHSCANKASVQSKS